MEGINAADILGIVFLGYGIIDVYKRQDIWSVL